MESLFFVTVCTIIISKVGSNYSTSSGDVNSVMPCKGWRVLYALDLRAKHNDRNVNYWRDTSMGAQAKKTETTGINLVGNRKMKKVDSKRVQKDAYTTMFPNRSQLSSTGFLKLYTLYFMSNAGRAVYGKEILDEIEDIFSGSIWKPSHGTLYPMLTKLEATGMITEDKNETITTEASSRPVKKYYRITPEGLAYMESQKDSFLHAVAASGKFFNQVLKKMYK